MRGLLGERSRGVDVSMASCDGQEEGEEGQGGDSAAAYNSVVVADDDVPYM